MVKKEREGDKVYKSDCLNNFVPAIWWSYTKHNAVSFNGDRCHTRVEWGERGE